MLYSLQCLVTCGKGHKHRQTWCQFGEDQLNDRFCDPETKPESVQTCQQQECASWQVGPWGQVPRGSWLVGPGCWWPRLGATLSSKLTSITALIGLHTKAALCSFGFSGWAAITVPALCAKFNLCHTKLAVIFKKRVSKVTLLNPYLGT